MIGIFCSLIRSFDFYKPVGSKLAYLNKCSLQAQGKWTKDGIPSSYESVESQVSYCIEESLRLFDSAKLFAIDVLTPGLNVKLEQKAIMQQDILFRLITSVLPVLSLNFMNIFLLLQSTGDAAGFNKYCKARRIKLPDSLSLDGLTKSTASQISEAIIERDLIDADSNKTINSVALMIAIKNNVGDPMIDNIQATVNQNSNLITILLNCDLTDKVTTGIIQKTARDNFKKSIQQMYYFRNIVQMSRPSLVPNEMGVLMFQPSKGWEVYVVNQNDLRGSGSLNRFMSLATFRRHPEDPTSENPPSFSLVATFDKIPQRDDLDAVISRARLTDK